MMCIVGKYKSLDFCGVKIKKPHNCDYVEHLYKQTCYITDLIITYPTKKINNFSKIYKKSPICTKKDGKS